MGEFRCFETLLETINHLRRYYIFYTRRDTPTSLIFKVLYAIFSIKKKKTLIIVILANF